MDALRRFKEQGRQFDFISLDADKPQHGEYYNMSLELLRPGGVLIMFGMLLFPTLEDQEAMEKLHEVLPYEQACYICGPEQAMLLRTLVGLARPRRALDIGSFTGYGSSAILEALPEDAELTCLEIDRDYTRLAAQTLRGRDANFMVGEAMDALRRFKEQGRQFDFISL